MGGASFRILAYTLLHTDRPVVKLVMVSKCLNPALMVGFFVIPMFFVSWHDGAIYGINQHECNVALANIICYGRL